MDSTKTHSPIRNNAVCMGNSFENEVSLDGTLIIKCYLFLNSAEFFAECVQLNKTTPPPHPNV